MSNSRLVLLLGEGFGERMTGRLLKIKFEDTVLDVRTTLEDDCPVVVIQDEPPRRGLFVTKGMLDRGLAVLIVEEVPDGDQG